MSFQGFPKLLKMPVLGKGVLAELRATPNIVRFGEVAQNQAADAVVLLENDNTAAPVRFEFGRGTMFTVKPSKGTVAAGQPVSCIVTYAPRALGKHQSHIPLKTLSSTGQVVSELSVAVSGECGAHTGIGRKLHVGGTDKLPEDFARERRYVDASTGFASTRPRFSRTHTLHKSENQERYTGVPVDRNTLSYDEAIRKAAHRDKYDAHLKDTRKAREAKTTLTELRKQGRDPAKMAVDNISLGLDAHSGMKPPMPKLPTPDDALFQLPSELAGGAKPRPRNRPAYHLEDGTIDVHPYASEPRTAEEVKMCNKALGAHEISKLICGPPVIDYGTICAAAKTRKVFAVTNNLAKPVHVRLNVEHLKDIEAEQPEGMVVPPGCHAGLGVFLCVPRVTAKYRELVTYSVNNGAHTFAFEMHAEVVPVNLKLDRETVIFRFTETNWEPFVEESVVLTNTSTYPADFKFEIPGPAFQCFPEKGQVDAKSSLTAIIKWTPSKLPNGNECSISLHVEGATTHKTVRCVGEAPEGKCTFKEKAVDLTEVAVGCPTNRFLTLKNVGQSDGFFNFDLPKTGDYTLRVEPPRGRLMVGASLEVEMEFEASVAAVYDLTLTANVRGGKPVKLPLHAEAIVPHVSMDVDEFDVGTVYLGGDRVIATTLTNESGIMAELEMDLRQYGAFGLVLPQVGVLRRATFLVSRFSRWKESRSHGRRLPKLM